ncbi:MAG TPA: bacteriocin-protection protein, partial [Thermoanaerobaculia bacterium]|nr:bacteriocin-protection protein [Thermoanaerobaculia bacterium]
MKPAFFATAAEFRRWLERHHDSERELLVGFYKRGFGRPSMTWPESVDQALCF